MRQPEYGLTLNGETWDLGCFPWSDESMSASDVWKGFNDYTYNFGNLLVRLWSIESVWFLFWFFIYYKIK